MRKFPNSVMTPHLQFLTDLVHYTRPEQILEIGTQYGESTRALLRGGYGNITTVDICGGDRCRIEMKEEGYNLSNVNFICLDSYYYTHPYPIDILLIDGNHKYEFVYTDLFRHGERSKMILLHDSMQPPVQEAIDDYVSYFSKTDIIKHTFGNGMTIINNFI